MLFYINWDFLIQPSFCWFTFNVSPNIGWRNINISSFWLKRGYGIIILIAISIINAYLKVFQYILCFIPAVDIRIIIRAHNKNELIRWMLSRYMMQGFGGIIWGGQIKFYRWRGKIRVALKGQANHGYSVSLWCNYFIFFKRTFRGNDKPDFVNYIHIKDSLGDLCMP